jgi:hypothetical protein
VAESGSNGVWQRAGRYPAGHTRLALRAFYHSSSDNCMEIMLDHFR